jgi:hypothetical protein
LEFKIKLERDTYNDGETARGTLFIGADESLKVRKLRFLVYCKERYEVITGYYGTSRAEKYDILFFEICPHF